MYSVPMKSERDVIDEVRDRLSRKFAGIPLTQVAATVDDSHEHFGESRIRDYVPLLVERRAARELARIAGHGLTELAGV
jgi:hypothetical protein